MGTTDQIKHMRERGEIIIRLNMDHNGGVKLDLHFPHLQGIAISLFTVLGFGILLNILSIFLITRWRTQITSWTQCLLVVNLAWMDVLVSGRDMFTLYQVIQHGVWPYETNICSHSINNIVYLLLAGTTIFSVMLPTATTTSQQTKPNDVSTDEKKFLPTWMECMHAMMHCSF